MTSPERSITAVAPVAPTDGAASTPANGAASGVEILELDRAECARLLSGAQVGRLVVTMPDGAPLIRPINYRFDAPSQSIVFSTGMGSKLHALLHTQRACFEVDAFDETGRTGWSVIVDGVAEPVDPASVAAAQDFDRWVPGAKGNWFRIRVVTMTGRRIARVDDGLNGYRA